MSVDIAMRTGPVLRQPPAHVFHCGGAWVEAQTSSAAVVLRVGGWIDASNLDQVTADLRRFTSMRAPLVVNLRKLDFLGVSAFRALIAIGAQYVEAAVPCAFVDGPALQPYTRVGWQNRSLPLVESETEALRLIGRDGRDVPETPWLRLVPRNRTQC